VYKNPKKPKPRGNSAMQPAAALGNDTGTTVRLIKGMGAGSQQDSTGRAFKDEAFWRRKVEEVPVNHVRDVHPNSLFHPIYLSSYKLFFHRFFMKKMERTQAIAEKVDKRKGVKIAREEGEMEDLGTEIPTKSTGKEDGVDELSSDDEELDEDEVWKVRLVPKQ
jgi:ribosome biogenesis protein MAK21